MLLTALALLSLEAAPPNDLFENRVEVKGPSGQLLASNGGATFEEKEPVHASAGGRSVWWTWTAPADGFAFVSTAGSGFDTLLAAYRGTRVDQLTKIASNDDNGESKQSLISFTAKSGTAYAIAVDGSAGGSGTVVLSWLLGPARGARPANDAFSDRQELEGPSGLAFGTNVGATKEAGEPVHGADAAGRTVWWSWTAPAGGVLTLTTTTSSFDTILAAYTGADLAALKLIAEDDDGGEEFTSFVSFDAMKGAEYAIAVDAYEADAGLVVLGWRFDEPCAAPDAPDAPDPAPGAKDVAVDGRLRWNVPRPERNVIYGEDGRLEVYEVTDPALQKALDSTVALVSLAGEIKKNPDGTYALAAQTAAEYYGLCPEERFRDEPVPAFCSGFLVAPDIVATAGHCVKDLAGCDDTAIVFGFRMLKAGEPALTIPESEVYFCAGVAASRVPDEPGDDDDWALIRLDRPVTNHAPLPIRRSGKVANGQSLLVMGHPLGLPAKVAGGATVRDNSGAATFVANLDVYGGSSGSAVLGAESLLVEGILVAGEEDFVAENGCLRSKQCTDTGCLGEVVVRASRFGFLVPPRRAEYDVYLGACGAMKLVGSSAEPEFAPGPLAPGTKYCWRVVARGDCGSMEGPEWSFTTGKAGLESFRRGDSTGDGDLNVTDAVRTLNFLFRGGAAPPCQDAADSDDSGLLDLSDAVYLLRFLYIGGPAPPAPFADCDVDPTPDEVGCVSGEPCA